MTGDRFSNETAYILTVKPTDPKGADFRQKWLPLMLAHKATNWSIARNLPHWEQIKARDVFLFLLQGGYQEYQNGKGQARQPQGAMKCALPRFIGSGEEYSLESL